MEMDDLLKMKMLGMNSGGGMTPYEQFKTQHIQAKNHTSGIAVTGLVTGIVGTVAGVTAWIFAPLYSNAKSREAKEAAYAAKEIANVQIAASQRQLDQLTNLLSAERNERLQGQTTISQTITDTISGQQTSQLTAQQAAELSSIQSVQQNLFNQAVMGNLSENPQKVMLYSAPQPCGCPGCGCDG